MLDEACEISQASFFCSCTLGCLGGENDREFTSVIQLLVAAIKRAEGPKRS